ncbi:putative cyclin-dependent kinase 9 [Colletotrichum viniferum]|nr:putative cyclin-dependent kinase 9 [Colletotrichum viniferum]
MGSQEYTELCRDIRRRLLDNLERKDSDKFRFATRDTAANVLESHYLRLFFQSINDDHFSISADDFTRNIRTRSLHNFIAIIAFAGCSIDAARVFTTKLAAADIWPVKQSHIKDATSLPADRDSLREFFVGCDSNDADVFFGSQAIFCTVVLLQREEVIVHDSETQRLPYLKEKQIGSGSFGKVYMVKIARGHIEDHRTDEVSNKPREVARKDYIVQSSSDMSSQDEGNVMKMILSASKTCENILENLGTLRVESPLGTDHSPTYSLFMPLAICDLGAYMKKDISTSIKTPKVRANLIRSAMGLATGLNFLHHELQTSDLEDVVCYHMDLKPSNILVFPGEDREHRQIWKLSDFGMSRVKVRRRNHAEPEERDFSVWFRPRPEVHEDAPSGTQNRRGQGTYLPRESFLAGKVMNTKSDIWSLGCVLSVFFAYLEGGADSVTQYTIDRLKDRKGLDDGFDSFVWEKSFGKFALHHAVLDWHHQLANKAGTRSSGEKKVVHTILSFLEHKALHLDQEKRCTAKDVENALKGAMAAYRHLESSPVPEEPKKPRKLSIIERIRSKSPEARPKGDRSIQQWRLAQDADDTMKSCKISPNGTMLVYWGDYKLILFTSLSAPLESEKALSPAGGFSLAGSAFYWKAVALTERYLIATTTGGTFNCYIFDLEAGQSVNADLETCYHVSLPHPEVNNLAISADHQVMICTLQNIENERLSGSLFQARILDLIESGRKVKPESTGWVSDRTNTPLSFQPPLKLSWPAEDTISMSLRNQTDGYMVVRPELTKHDIHKASIVHFSFKTKSIDRVDLIPQ